VRVLAIDTTSPRGSVAVAGPEGVLAEARLVTTDGHSRWILPAAEALLGGLGLAASALDLFAVTTGPGSFTGLRVGLGSVQGLALASGRPCVGLPTLDVLATAAAGTSETIVALVDAFRGEVYSGVYDAAGRLRRPYGTGTLEALLEGLPPGAAFVGLAALERREPIRAAVHGAIFPASDEFLAAPLARAALQVAASGGAVPAAGLRPLYLRGVDARPTPA
jgi:tRNA threonylcarbamoyladenosine biosynthesis protein TsaB